MKRPPLSPEMRQFILITLVVFIMLVVVNHYSPDDTLIAATLAIAIYTLFFATLSLKASRDSLKLTEKSLELTKKSLELTTLDVNTRIRPFVSAMPLQSTGSTSDQGTSSYTISLLSFILQNTGVTPAYQVELHYYLKNMDTGEILDQAEDHCPSLPPNSSYTAKWRPTAHTRFVKDHLAIQVRILYHGQNQSSYPSLQTWLIQESLIPSIPPTLAFIPTEPTSFS